MHQQDVLNEIKYYINLDKLSSLQHLLFDLLDNNPLSEYRPNWEFLWHHAFVHACLRNKVAIKEWLLEIYDTFDITTKIALKPTLLYAKYLRSI